MANDMGEDEVDEVFRGVCMALMSDDGRLKRVHDSTVSLEVCPRQYEVEIRVVKGFLIFSAINVRCTAVVTQLSRVLFYDTFILSSVACDIGAT